MQIGSNGVRALEWAFFREQTATFNPTRRLNVLRESMLVSGTLWDEEHRRRVDEELTSEEEVGGFVTNDVEMIIAHVNKPFCPYRPQVTI